MAKARLVRTRHVTITSPEGERLKKPVWSRAKVWKRYKDIVSNLKQAITYAREMVETRQIGTVVYVGEIPVFHAKWGGGRAFTGWKANPAAEYWRRKLRGS